MKSVKPGRGPSTMGGIGSIAAVIFGIGWMIFASQIGAPSIFSLFGVVFIGMAIASAIYHFKNATGKNRMSIFDITDGEPDPLDPYINRTSTPNERNESSARMQRASNSQVQYCPYCGNKVDPSHKFCSSCGKQVRN